MINKTKLYAKLIDSLKLLSVDATAQISCLPKEVCVTDEIALLFDEVYKQFEASELKNELPIAVVGNLKNINFLLEKMSGPNGPWSINDLSSHQSWRELRKISGETLALLGEQSGKPKIDWVTFVTDKE